LCLFFFERGLVEMLKKIILIIGCICAFLLVGCNDDEPVTGLAQDSDYVYHTEGDSIPVVDYTPEVTEETETIEETEPTEKTEADEQSDDTLNTPQLPTDDNADNDYNVVDHVNHTRYWIVQPGDTLFSISRFAISTVAEIQRINNMGDSTDIMVGQRIYLPPRPELPNLTIRWLGFEDAVRPENTPTFYWSDTAGATLVFEPGEVMRDFELFRADNSSGEQWQRSVGEVIHRAGTLDSNNHLIVDNFWFDGGAGLLNVTSGFSFVNAEGIRRFFVFGENTAYPDHGTSPISVAEFLN